MQKCRYLVNWGLVNHNKAIFNENDGRKDCANNNFAEKHSRIRQTVDYRRPHNSKTKIYRLIELWVWTRHQLLHKSNRFNHLASSYNSLHELRRCDSLQHFGSPNPIACIVTFSFCPIIQIIDIALTTIDSISVSNSTNKQSTEHFSKQISAICRQWERRVL